MSDAFGKEYHLWMLVESVVHQVKYSQLCMFKRKCYWEILFSWKKILKGCVITSEKIDINLCQIQTWKLFLHVLLMHQMCIKHHKYALKILCSNHSVGKTWGNLILSLIVPIWKVISYSEDL